MGVKRLIAVAFEGETDPELDKWVDEVIWLKVGRLSQLISAFAERGVKQCVMVGQIVGNLVDNARKYTRDAADPRIWVWARPAGRRWVVFEVEDRGCGVPPRERAAIFRPFRRGAAADTKAGGAGLGLALARQWAEALGGRLTYRPADGGTGACFRLELRVK